MLWNHVIHIVEMALKDWRVKYELVHPRMVTALLLRASGKGIWWISPYLIPKLANSQKLFNNYKELGRIVISSCRSTLDKTHNYDHSYSHF